jgi:hypothetical protein
MSIHRYRLVYPGITIIISTWVDTNQFYLDSIRTLLSHDPHLYLLVSDKPPCNGPANSNLQIVSTLQGLRLARKLGLTYSLKCRTDQIFCQLSFLDQLITLHARFRTKVANLQLGRIVVGSMGSFRARPFSVSDFFSFGYTQDLILMWDLELDRDGSNPREVTVRSPSKHDVRPMLTSDMTHLEFSISSTRGCEPYFVSKLLENSDYSYSHDWNDSENFLASCFIIADSCSLGQVWPKYGMTSSFSKYRCGHAWGETFAASHYGMSEINFVNWLEFYCRYTNRTL